MEKILIVNASPRAPKSNSKNLRNFSATAARIVCTEKLFAQTLTNLQPMHKIANI